MLRFAKALCGLALVALLLPAGGRSQERVIVSKEISVGRSEAALSLEFADGGKLSLALRSGSVLIDGEPAGSHAAGDALDAAWRALLGEAVALEDGPLAERLWAWSPPSALEGDALASARRLDEALEGALSVPVPPTPPAAPTLGAEDEGALVKLLVGQTSRLALLGEALKGLSSEVRLHIQEDVEVAAGETFEGDLVVIQGDARVEGTVTGNVVVVDGTLELPEGALVHGDVRLVDGELEDEGGEVEGQLLHLDGPEALVDEQVRERLREEVRAELRSELGDPDRGRRAGFFNPLRRAAEGVGGIIETLVAVFVLGLVGLGVVAFAPQNLDAVAEAARRAPGRAAMVGVAGTFLLVPVWVLGFVALLITIVGIPVAIAWLPLFPVAAVAAALLGYVAVARNVGEWLSGSGYPYTDWIRKSNAMTTITGGLLGIMAFFLAANLLGIVPFFGFLEGLLTAAGILATLAAALVGFGAVLLTRAGRRAEYAPKDFDEAWQRAVDVDLEVDAAPRQGAQGPDGEGGGSHA